MPATQRGVYHNLKESKYTISNSEVVFFFSSEFTLNKFMMGYQKYREQMRQRKTRFIDTPLNFDTLADIEFYRRAEKRGFYVWIKGVSVDWDDLHLYSLRKMSVKESPDWKVIERPKVHERLSMYEKI